MTGAVRGPVNSTPGYDGQQTAAPGHAIRQPASQPTGQPTGPLTGPLTAESLVNQLAGALHLPEPRRTAARPFLAVLQAPSKHAGALQLPPSFNAPTFNAPTSSTAAHKVAAPAPDRDFLFEDFWSRQADTDAFQHHDALPRLFYRASSERSALPAQRAQRPVQYPLAVKSMACGFAVGIAIAGPAMWLSSDPNGRQAPSSITLQATLAGPALLAAGTVSVGANLTTTRPVSADASADSALAAFEEAQRRIAAGDYIGARDFFRQAVDAGEDRAQAWLDALN
jgi:hypothetical protein